MSIFSCWSGNSLPLHCRSGNFWTHRKKTRKILPWWTGWTLVTAFRPLYPTCIWQPCSFVPRGHCLSLSQMVANEELSPVFSMSRRMAPVLCASPCLITLCPKTMPPILTSLMTNTALPCLWNSVWRTSQSLVSSESVDWSFEMNDCSHHVLQYWLVHFMNDDDVQPAEKKPKSLKGNQECCGK